MSSALEAAKKPVPAAIVSAVLAFGAGRGTAPQQIPTPSQEHLHAITVRQVGPPGSYEARGSFTLRPEGKLPPLEHDVVVHLTETQATEVRLAVNAAAAKCPGFPTPFTTSLLAASDGMRVILTGPMAEVCDAQLPNSGLMSVVADLVVEAKKGMP